MITYTKDPDAKLDYSVDWTSWLNTGATVDSVTWLVPSGLTNESESLSGAVATVILSGGTAGQQYQITCRVTDSAGLIDDRSFMIRCKNL